MRPPIMGSQLQLTNIFQLGGPAERVDATSQGKSTKFLHLEKNNLVVDIWFKYMWCIAFPNLKIKFNDDDKF